MVKLNSSVRLVALQFSFSNPNVIPDSIKLRRKENRKERTIRKNYSGGVMVMAPTEKCSIAEFLGELETAGYEMVDAFYEERIDPKRSRKTYYMVRFVFSRREFVEISDSFKKVRDVIRIDLENICETSMWRVRSFLNPFYEDGAEVPGQHVASINLEVRQPLFEPSGAPVAIWQKDTSGRRIGNAPVLLRADYLLRVIGGDVNLVAAQ